MISPNDSMRPSRLLVAANDNLPAVRTSSLTKQVDLTALLHADGLGVFPSEDLCNFVDNYILQGKKPAPPGKVFRLSDDNGDDVWVAVILERDRSVKEPWGIETYRTEAEAIAAIYAELLEDAA